MMTLFKKYCIFFILVLAFLLRIIFLDKLPTGISFDELEYILNAKAVYVTHSDIGGKWNPLSLTTPSCCFPQAELPSVIISPFIGPLPFSLPTARLPYMLISILSVFFLYLISKKLLDKSKALLITLVAAINPWNIFFARTAYDTPLSTLFLLVGIYFLLRAKKWQILLVAIPFFFSFFTYIGTKVVYPMYLLFLIPFTYFFIKNKKDGKWYISLFLLSLVPLFLYILLAHTSGVSRLNEISNPSQLSIIHDTNVLRQLSLDTPLKSFFVNKYVIFSFSSFEKYLNTFNPNFLFFHGDNKFLFTVWYTGAFYYTDVIFLMLGFAYLFSINKKVWAFITGLILIAPIPSVVSNVGSSYAIRSFPMLFFLCIFIGLGMYASYMYIKQKKLKKVFVIAIILVYLFQISNFLFVYSFVNPIANSESFSFSSRVLSRYLTITKQTSPITVVAQQPQSPLKQYIFYRGRFDQKAQSILQELHKKNTFLFEGITFTTCNEYTPKENETVIFESGLKCAKVPSAPSVAITRLSDAGSVFTIYNDKTCLHYNLNSYPQYITFSDLSVEKLSLQRFCQQFISKF